MFIIASDIIINMDNVSAVFVNSKQHLQFEVPNGAFTLGNIPENALQQVAVAAAENKTYLEMDDAAIVVEEEESNDVGSDIE